jgi:hypothetical protein
VRPVARYSTIAGLTSLVLAACSRPPPAPETLDELMAFAFAHTADEDDRSLVEACGNLSAWLEGNLASTVEGYEVFDLQAEAVEALGDTPPDLDHLVGAAVGHASPHPADVLGGQNAVPDGTDLSVPPEEGVGRIYRTDAACFDAGDCDWLESEEWIDDSGLPLGVSADVHWYQEWRWVHLDAGRAMLQRYWLVEPIDFNVDFLEVDHQYFLWVFLPNADGTSRSVQATWISATLTGAPVPESVALSLVVDEMGGTAQSLDDTIAAQSE